VFSFDQLHAEDAMSACKSLAAGAVLSLISLPALAQAVISEPGYCAFFYPNANCQNKGPGNPYTGDYQRNSGYGSYGYGSYGYRSYGYGPYGAAQGGPVPGQTVGAAPARHRSHRATPKMQ
jgi:hypothetical protein